MKERIKSIDSIKVLAIISVIGFHVAYNLRNTNTRWIGFIGVSLFFIVSGYTLSKNYPTIKEFSSMIF
ncbi:MAG: acyltransferase family protein [Nanoarchaeota archaeon]|jgi:peptidoglycan/LPS O-acetylase OafA/YrhL|nr:acyltransferase family protein [Nanoarchaeota archaeon]